MTDGYYRFPTMHENNVVFVCEDDLWTVNADGGVARRLTTNLGISSHPALSPDGQLLAFIGREEGEAEVYVMPAKGGAAKRLTYLGSATTVLDWTPDGKIIIASHVGQPFAQLTSLYTLSPDGGQPEPLPYGPARSISFGPDGGVVIGRRAEDLARWKRYRGGTAGDIWIDVKGKGKFKSLLKLKSNLAKPMWIGERIYFLSDHEGIGNIYSCDLKGKNVQRHTHHEDFYVRQPDTDGQRIIYRAGADLFIFNPAQKGAKAIQKVEIEYHSPRVQLNRKFVKPENYLERIALHPVGHSVTMSVRGKFFSMANWDGAVFQYGERRGVRYRLAEWLNDGKRLVMVSDATGEEALEIHTDASLPATEHNVERLDGLDFGRAVSLAVSPRADAVVITNHRLELIYVDLKEKTTKLLDKSNFGRIAGIDWSPDGQWVAYGFRTSHHTCAIKLCQIETGETHFVTPPNNFLDFGPNFDPGGKYLYFISYREFDPVYDRLYFDLNFPRGSRPYLVTLQKDSPNPFMAMPPNANNGDKPEQTSKNGKNGENGPDEAKAKDETESKEEKKEKNGEKPLQIDLDGIQQRVSAFPVSEGLYSQVKGIKDKVYFTSFPVEGSLNRSWRNNNHEVGKGALEWYDFVEKKKEFVVSGLNWFELNRKRDYLIYRSGKNMRVLKAGEKPDNNAGGFTKKSGWIKLNRLSVEISPPAEWSQMFQEAWRLQRDHFWSEDMSSVDWQTVYQRYYPLVERVSSRIEFSDLLWEMQGELGTSHAYELGGDYRRTPRYAQGFLGANFEYDAETDGYRVTHIVDGDTWIRRSDSPLNRLGVNVKPGDILLAIDGQRLSLEMTPQQMLVNRAHDEIQLTILPADGSSSSANGDGPQPLAHTVLVRALSNEMPARYREWVEANRRRVHEETDGRVGYVHIPNMGPVGYAEFHRYYLAEAERQGLIVDVRFNGGGHVSQLLIEKLARRRLGYDQPRYGQASSYPLHAVLGPMVALANEYAGSDGDIFSHVFKLMKLGPLIGKRTWGGVIGISPRHALVDGTITTQPEYSFWFEDVGWGVENYGTDPDIEVDIKPQDYAKGQDTQLDRALAEIMKLLEQDPPQIPDFGPRPRLELPKLPKKK